MMIQKKITNRVSQRSARPLFVGTWTLTLACGVLVAACSGTIDTPSEEFPPRRPSSSSDTPAPAPAAPARPAPAPAANNNGGTASAPPPSAAASNDDEEDVDEAPPVAPEPEPPAASGDLSFETDVWPIFQTSCAPCHQTLALGGLNIGSDDLEEALSDSIDFEDGVLRAIEAGTMPQGSCGGPPGSSGCVSEDDFATIEAWYEAGAPE